jgi:hypothetical protein
MSEKREPRLWPFSVCMSACSRLSMAANVLRVKTIICFVASEMRAEREKGLLRGALRE